MADCCAQLKRDISELKSLLEGLPKNSDLKALERRVYYLEGRITDKLDRAEKPGIIKASAAAAMFEIRPEIVALGAIAAAAQVAAKAAAAQAAVAAASIGALAARLAALAAQVAGVAAAVAGLVAAIATLKVLGTRIDAVESGVDRLGADLSKVLGLIGGIRGTANTAINVAGAANSKASAAQAGLSGLTAKVDNLNNIAAEARSNASKALIEVSTLKPKVASLNDGVAQANSNASKALVQLSSIQPRLKTLNDVSAQANSNASKALNQLTSIQPRLKTLNDVSAQANSNASKSLIQLNAIAPKVTNLNNIAAEARSNASKALTQLSTMTGAVTNATNTAAAAQTAATNATNTANRATTNATNAATAATAATNATTAATNAIASLKTQLNNLWASHNYLSRLVDPFLTGGIVDGTARKMASSASAAANNAHIRIMGLESAVAGIPVAVAATLSPSLLQIQSQTAPAAISSAAAAGVCSTTKPGGCLGNQFGGLNNRLNGIQGLLQQTGITALGAQMSAGFAATQARITAVEGLVALNFTRLTTWLKFSQIIVVLNLYTSIHNAYFLSSNLTQTLFSAIGNVGAAFGVRDVEGNPYDVGSVVGKRIDTIAQGLFGVETWTGIKTEWKALSRIYQSASNVIWSVQSIFSSMRSLTEIAIEHTGKIGNALRKAGAVFENAYGHMSERPTARNAFQRRWDNILEGVESFEQAVSTIDSAAQEVLSIQQTFDELKKQKEEVKKSVDDSKTAAAALELLEKEASKAPQL